MIHLLIIMTPSVVLKIMDTLNVKLLLKEPLVDPCADNNYAIRWASWNGHVEGVKLLLNDPRADLSADRNYAICLASRGGHVDVVKLLLDDPRIDPSDDINRAIR